MMEKKVWLAKVLINMLKDKIKYEWEAKEGYEKTEKRNTRQGGGELSSPGWNPAHQGRKLG